MGAASCSHLAHDGTTPAGTGRHQTTLEATTPSSVIGSFILPLFVFPSMHAASGLAPGERALFIVVHPSGRNLVFEVDAPVEEFDNLLASAMSVLNTVRIQNKPFRPRGAAVCGA